MLRRRRASERSANRSSDRSALDPRWQRHVDEVLATRDRFRSVTSRARSGEIKARLEMLSTQVDAAVTSSVRVAERAQELEAILRDLNPESIGARLKAARRRQSAGGDELLDAEVRSLAAQHSAANRLWNELEGCERQLRLIDVRLDEAVAHATDLAVGSRSARPITVDDELTAVIDDLAALRAALDELAPHSGR